MDNWVLQVEAGPDSGRTFPVPAAGVIIGRQAGVEIALADPLMSRRHARLDLRDGRVYVTDLNSSNGTRRNGRPVEGTEEVHFGDILELGDTRLRLAWAAGVAEAAAGAAQPAPPPVAERQTILRPMVDNPTVIPPAREEARPAIGVGSLLNGRYRLDRQIGRGGFARVYLATDLTLGRPVAAKVLDPELVEQADERDFLARFAAEARAVALLDHPNILSVFDYGQAAETAFLVMPYVEGGTLYDRLRAAGPLDPAQVASYLRQAAAALDYAHRRSLVHRDIKPQNMLLRAEDDRLLLADFGIAKVLSSASTHSRTGIMGTVGYMAPEQFKGEVERATDLYALGCVLFQLLTGQLPFQGPTERVMYAHLHEPVPPLASRGGAHLPTAIQPVLDRALAKAPGDRFASAGAFADAFAAALSGEQRTMPAQGTAPMADGGWSAAPTQIAATPPRPLAAESPTIAATPAQPLERTRPDRTPSRGPDASPAWPSASEQTTTMSETQVGGLPPVSSPPQREAAPVPSPAPSARISRRALVGGGAGIGLSVIGVGGLLAVRGAGGTSPTATASRSAGGAGTAVPAAPVATATTVSSPPPSARPSALPTATTAPTARPSAAPPAASAAASAPGISTGSDTTLSAWPTNLPQPTDLAADQTFNQANDYDPSDFDTNKNLYNGGSSLIWQGLLRYDPDYGLCAGDAVSYEVKNAGAQYIFKLNPKAAFSNGDPITAQTYIDAWTRQLDPATAAAYAGFLLDIKNAESFNSKKGATAKDLGLRAVDAQTLEATLERPAGYFPILAAYLAAVPAHKPSIDKFGDKWTEPSVTGAPIVSNGPFVLTKWERGKSFTLERNERYAAGPKPFLKTINYTITPPSAGLAPYESGNLDYRSFTGIPAGEIPRLISDPVLKQQLYRHSQSGLWYLVPEVDKVPFSGTDGLKVRQAMQRAIDRDQLVKVIQNLGEPAYSLTPPDHPLFIDPAKYPEFKNAVSYNPDAAKKLLDGTPYAGGKGFPKVTMSMRDEGAAPRTAAEFIQKSLKDNLGMDIEFDIKPSSQFTAPLYNRQYQLIFLRWYMDYPDPSNQYKDVFYSRKSSGKRQAWSNSTFDDLVLQAGGTADPEQRAKLYRDAERVLLLTDAAYSPLYYGYAYALFKPRVGGIPKTKVGVAQPNWNLFIDMQRTLYIKK